MPSDSTHRRNVPTRIAPSVPAGTCPWITAELIEQTIRVWEPRYGRTLSVDDAVEILTSVGLLLDALSPKLGPPQSASQAQSA